MRRCQFWRIPRDGGKGWGARLRIGRVQVGYLVYKHVYATTSDRWVFKPELIYDRKRGAS